MHDGCFIICLVPCEPPTDIRGAPLGMTEFNITFTPAPCQADGSLLYFYYRLDTGQTSREWLITGIDANASDVVLYNLLPALPYKGYFVTSSKSGNGPISKVIYFSTPLGRKYYMFISY